MEIELGAPGQLIPPVDRGIGSAVRMEEAGYDAVWWADHLMGWHPQSLWHEDITPLARYQKSPHVYVDPFAMISAVATQTQTARLGTCVTDLLRRHPASIAQTMLTLDHVSKGRAILGIGSGEQLNISPYGIPWDKPVGRLDEGLQVIRKLMAAGTDPIDFEGKHYALKDAVLGLEPYGDLPPEIWVAAHGPRMLGICGRQADGWLPTKMTPDEYAGSLADIRSAAKEAGRDDRKFTPGMLAYVLLAPDEETVQKLLAAPLLRMLCILLPNYVFERLGVTPPLGTGAGSGFHDFIPTRVPRAAAERIARDIPPHVTKYYAFAGTVEQVAEEITSYQRAGLRHLVMWNVTGLGIPELTKFSFDAMDQLQKILKSA